MALHEDRKRSSPSLRGTLVVIALLLAAAGGLSALCIRDWRRVPPPRVVATTELPIAVHSSHPPAPRLLEQVDAGTSAVVAQAATSNDPDSDESESDSGANQAPRFPPIDSFEMTPAPGFPISRAAASVELQDGGAVVRVEIEVGAKRCGQFIRDDRIVRLAIDQWERGAGRPYTPVPITPRTYRLSPVANSDGLLAMAWFSRMDGLSSRYFEAEAFSEEGEITLSEIDRAHVSGSFRAHIIANAFLEDGGRLNLGWFSGRFNAVTCESLASKSSDSAAARSPR